MRFSLQDIVPLRIHNSNNITLSIQTIEKIMLSVKFMFTLFIVFFVFVLADYSKLNLRAAKWRVCNLNCQQSTKATIRLF